MHRPLDADRVLEQLLVLRAQLGDRGAHGRLFERHGPQLRYYLRRLVSDEQEVEDLEQETWLSVVRKIKRLQQPAAFRSWLYRVARNHALSSLRRRRAEVSLEAAPEEHLAAPPEASADLTEFEQFDAGAVHAGLDRLPPAQREVLTLRFIEDLSYEEIASVVGCRPGTVRSRIHYGKQALQLALTQPLSTRVEPRKQRNS